MARYHASPALACPGDSLFQEPNRSDSFVFLPLKKSFASIRVDSRFFFSRVYSRLGYSSSKLDWVKCSVWLFSETMRFTFSGMPSAIVAWISSVT